MAVGAITLGVILIMDMAGVAAGDGATTILGLILTMVTADITTAITMVIIMVTMMVIMVTDMVTETMAIMATAITVITTEQILQRVQIPIQEAFHQQF